MDGHDATCYNTRNGAKQDTRSHNNNSRRQDMADDTVQTSRSFHHRSTQIKLIVLATIHLA
jgi:hypothetical protein